MFYKVFILGFIRINPERVRREHLPARSEAYRVRESEAFSSRYSKNKKIIPMETLPAREQDENVKKILLLGQPQTRDEVLAQDFLEKVKVAG